MKITLEVVNRQLRITPADDEAAELYATPKKRLLPIYLLGTALMWEFGANVDKESGHKGQQGYDCDAVDAAHKAIY